ncbi:MAG: hypothetical protein ACI9EF_002428 [Pseudohongiellaceae bacterium]|jgi:hypothetical protein
MAFSIYLRVSIWALIHITILSLKTMTESIDWAELKQRRHELSGRPDEQQVETHIENWRRRLLRKEASWEETLDRELLDLLHRIQTAL